MSLFLDEQTTAVFIKALRDPEVADTLSLLANNTDESMPKPIQDQAWKRIEQTLGAIIPRWSAPIISNYELEEIAE